MSPWGGLVKKCKLLTAWYIHTHTPHTQYTLQEFIFPSSQTMTAENPQYSNEFFSKCLFLNRMFVTPFISVPSFDMLLMNAYYVPGWWRTSHTVV